MSRNTGFIIGSDSSKETTSVAQNGHGLAFLDAVYQDGAGLWQKAQSDVGTTVGTHVVVEVVDIDNFKITDNSVIEATAHGFSFGATLYVSDATAGLITETVPTLGTSYNNAIAQVIDADTLEIIKVRPIINQNDIAPSIKREDFVSFVGGETSITLADPIPVNVELNVHRNGRLLREGVANDYTVSGQVVTLNSAIITGESMVTMWVSREADMFTESFAPAAGTTAFNVTVNSATLPTLDENVLFYRNGRLLREGAANDYTISGNTITINTASTAGETFITRFII